MTTQPSDNPATSLHAESEHPPRSTPDTQQEELYTSLESYPWHTDAEFQSGLRAILGQPATTTTTTTPTLTPTKSAAAPAPESEKPPEPQQVQAQVIDPEQVKDLTLRARCFYYSRMNPSSTVDFEAYKAWRDRQAPAALSSLTPIPGSELPVPAFTDSEPSSADVTPQKAENRRRSVLSGGYGQLEGAMTASMSSSTSATDVQQSESLTGEDEETMQPRSMAEIMELIRTGQPIPGIKEIPDTVLVGQGSEAIRSRRKKPWERDESGGIEKVDIFLAGSYTGGGNNPAS